MKKLLVISALVLVVGSGGWLLSHRVAREALSSQPASKPEANSGSATVPVAAVGVSPTASKAVQVSEVRQALEQLKTIYGPAGSLEWDAAKALIAQRQKIGRG